MITQKELFKLFSYDTDKGGFLWIAFGKGKGRYNKKPAGTIDRQGYVRVMINNKAYKAHRLVWLWHYGCFPKSDLDHINQNKSDNRIENLREVSNIENSKNSKLYKNNTSGVAGVTKHRKKWVAQICVNYKNIRLGSFNTKEEAVTARKQANLKYGFHKNHGT